MYYRKPINDHRFHWLTGDVNYKDYGGTWYRMDDPTTYTTIELINMDEVDKDCKEGRYLCIVNEIDIDCDSERITSALECAGYNLSDIEKDPLLLVEALLCYGGNTYHEYSNNYRNWQQTRHSRGTPIWLIL